MICCGWSDADAGAAPRAAANTMSRIHKRDSLFMAIPPVSETFSKSASEGSKASTPEGYGAAAQNAAGGVEERTILSVRRTGPQARRARSAPVAGSPRGPIDGSRHSALVGFRPGLRLSRLLHPPRLLRRSPPGG